MADRPILFSAPMVRALLDGRKTQTRRILKPQPTSHVWRHGWSRDDGATWSDETTTRKIPFWAGDRLWVREEFSGPYQFKPKVNPPTTWPVGCDIWYWADGNPDYGDWTKPKRSMHMPRWMSRLTLIVTDVRVERLQDISEEDAIAEGIEPVYDERSPGQTLWKDYECYPDKTPHAHSVVPFVLPSRSYCSLWEEINGHGSWIDNPWVVAYSFRVIKQNIDQIEKVAA